MVDFNLSIVLPGVRDDEFLTRSDVVLSGNDVSFKFNNNNGPDGTYTTYTGINGVDVADGETITLPSGALLTLFENGRFEYDPNGAVAQNGVDEIDTFTYTAQPLRFVTDARAQEEAPPQPVTATVEIIVQAADRPDEAFIGDMPMTNSPVARATIHSMAGPGMTNSSVATVMTFYSAATETINCLAAMGTTF